MLPSAKYGHITHYYTSSNFITLHVIHGKKALVAISTTLFHRPNFFPFRFGGFGSARFDFLLLLCIVLVAHFCRKKAATANVLFTYFICMNIFSTIINYMIDNTCILCVSDVSGFGKSESKGGAGER